MPPLSKPSMQKRQTIQRTLRATRARRRTQICRVYQLKVTRNKLSRATRAHLRRLFLEAKWFLNWALSCPDLFALDTTRKTVPVKVGETFEERPLRCLSSQMKQGLVTQLHHAVSTLATLKAQVGRLKYKTRVQGRKVGRLKYKTRVQCFRILKERCPTPIELPRHFPSTQLCSACGYRQKLTLAERVYHCPRCGLVRDRDHNAAINLLLAGLEVYKPQEKKKSALGPGRIEVTPAEITAATRQMVEHLNGLPYVRASRVEEPGSLMALA